MELMIRWEVFQSYLQGPLNSRRVLEWWFLQQFKSSVMPSKQVKLAELQLMETCSTYLPIFGMSSRNYTIKKHTKDSSYIASC